MELRHLRYFIAVAEELHFGKAAERLCIAQPPLSQQIQQLEKEIGFSLFNRTQRKVELTDAGRLFLDEARSALANLEKAATAGRRIARGEVGWLGIGFVGTATYRYLPAILSEFRQRYPDVELVLRELVTARQADALREKRIHVGLARPAIHEEDLVCKAIVKEQLMAVLPQHHRMSQWKKCELSALSSERFVLFPRYPKPSYADYIYGICAGYGFTPNVVQESAEIHTAISLVAAGIGITLAPESVCTAHREGVVYIPIASPDTATELNLVYRHGDHSPVLQNFLRIAETECVKSL